MLVVNQEEIVQIEARDLPVLYDVDVVVTGGSFAGVSAAIAFAKKGKKVALIESRTYLGREVTATLRPWLTTTQDLNITGLMRDIISQGKEKAGEIALNMDKVKLHLEDALLEANVQLLYASYPTAVQTDENGKKTVVIGNKSGRQVIKAGLIIDSTESASVMNLVDDQVKPHENAQLHYLKTIEFHRVGELHEQTLNIPEQIGIENNMVRVHQGYMENGHILIESMLTLDDEIHDKSMDKMMAREIQSRHTVMAVAEYLIQHHPAFRRAYLATTSYELQPVHSPGNPIEITGDVNAWLADFVSQKDPQVWCLNEAGCGEYGATLFSNPITASKLGEEIVEHINAHWNDLRHGAHEEPTRETAGTKPRQWTVAELQQPQAGKAYQRYVVDEMDIPVFQQTDVLVVGGGTSGATAAITSAKEGLQTILLEMNPGLGGTATLGGVDSYWFGRRVGFNAQVTERVNDMHQRINHRSSKSKWNIEAKMYALLNEAEKAGVQTYFHAVTIGTIMDKDRVRGVVIATRFGTYAIVAETVIDATGDGDVAAFAGAPYVYGSERDHIVMWYSLAQFHQPGRTQNNFTSMVDVSNVEDYTRAILEGRRRKRDKDVHDHGIYVASRETRHILGAEVMTLTDQLRQRQWEDVINIHFSNHDMKGKNGADWMHLGLIPPNLNIEVPYRILLPKGLEGILIAGKAVSATHDAFAAIRMQSDLENLGGVVALAAAQAIREKQLPRQLDLHTLQQRLVQEGLLPEDIMNRQIEDKTYTNEELKTLVDQLDGDQPLYLYADMKMNEVFTEKIPIVEVCTVGPRIIPFLTGALTRAKEEKNEGKQLILAQALCLYESPAGVPILIDKITDELSQGALPVRDNLIHHTQLPPDQGAMPDVVYLIYTLGLAKDKRSLHIWERIAEMLDPTEQHLKDMHKGTFYYVDAVCFGVERLADPACIPILEKLYTHENLSNQLRTSGIEPDYFKERQAMLDLSIARALARCGSKQGYDILMSYLEDTRSLLAEHAHTELKQITGKDFQKNKQAWSTHLETIQHELPLAPVLDKLDR